MLRRDEVHGDQPADRAAHRETTDRRTHTRRSSKKVDGTPGGVGPPAAEELHGHAPALMRCGICRARRPAVEPDVIRSANDCTRTSPSGAQSSSSCGRGRRLLATAARELEAVHRRVGRARQLVEPAKRENVYMGLTVPSGRRIVLGWQRVVHGRTRRPRSDEPGGAATLLISACNIVSRQRARPPRNVSSMMKHAPHTSPPSISTRPGIASTVPPVASTSSWITTRASLGSVRVRLERVFAVFEFVVAPFVSGGSFPGRRAGRSRPDLGAIAAPRMGRAPRLRAIEVPALRSRSGGELLIVCSSPPGSASSGVMSSTRRRAQKSSTSRIIVADRSLICRRPPSACASRSGEPSSCAARSAIEGRGGPRRGAPRSRARSAGATSCSSSAARGRRPS